MNKKDRHSKDKFSITIFGVVLYSVLLIGVMGASYVGVKAILLSNQESAITTVEKEEVIEGVPDAPEEIATIEDIVEEIEEEVEEDAEPEKEDQLSEHAIELEKMLDEETGYVDYSIVNFRPAKRDMNVKWKDNVFSRIENVNEPSIAPVNHYDYRRITAILANLDNVEYRVYTNPENKQIEKIKETVSCGEEVEIYDYYYDQGSINYIAQCRMKIDKPIPISSGAIEARYYYCKDILARFIYCENGKATEYSVKDLSTYSKGTIDQYDYLEKTLLNRAYDVYNLVQELPDDKILYGYVLDEYSMPIENALVEVKSEKDDKVIASTSTDGDGYYKISVPSSKEYKYYISANIDGLNGVNVYDVEVAPESLRYAVDPIYLGYSNDSLALNVQILVRDAFDSSKGLAGAALKIRRGINDFVADEIASATLDDTGAALLSLYPGSYTAEVVKGGYETSYFTVIVRSDHQAVVGFAVPDVKENECVAVLSWENTPLDLDIKAVTSNQGRVISSKTDSLGAVMAETICIDDVNLDDYRLYITDFGSISTGDALAYNLTSSNAIVTVYDAGGYVSSYHVPVASAGICWEAIEIRDGKVLPVNSFYYVIENDQLWNHK